MVFIEFFMPVKNAMVFIEFFVPVENTMAVSELDTSDMFD